MHSGVYFSMEVTAPLTSLLNSAKAAPEKSWSRNFFTATSCKSINQHQAVSVRKVDHCITYIDVYKFKKDHKSKRGIR